MNTVSVDNLWQIVTMADIAAKVPNALAIGPFGSDLRTTDYVADGVPVVFVKNVQPNVYCPEGGRFVSDYKAEQLAAHKVTPGDLVITKMGLPPCVAAIYPDDTPDGIVTADIIKLTPNRDCIDPRYVSYFLNSSSARSQIEAFTNGVTRPKVRLGAFRLMWIPLPPLPEQKRIADILDKADAIRRKRQEAAKECDDFLTSAFNTLFGDPVENPNDWKETTLDDVAHLQSGVTKGRNFADQQTVAVPYMRVWNVQDGHLRLDDIKDITVLPNDVEKYALQEGDLLLTEGGDPDQLGRGAIWYAPIPVCIHQNHIFRVRCDQQVIIPEFLSALIGSPKGKRYFLKMAKQTTGIASINMTQLRKCPVFLPPLPLQQQFARVDRQFEKTRGTLNARFDMVDQLFNSLVQRAFKGQL